MQSEAQREEFRERLQQTIQDARAAAEQAGAPDAGRVIVAPQAPVGIATTEQLPPWAYQDDMPPRVQETAFAFFVMVAVIFIGFPIARAIGRRIDRAGITPKVSVEVTSQLAQLNQAVEAIAVEVERISEGQRFTTRLLSEQHKLPGANRDIS